MLRRVSTVSASGHVSAGERLSVKARYAPIPLHACSKEEIEICAILSFGLNGSSYELFRAGHNMRLPGLPPPDFVHGTVIYQYDGMAFHGEDREERDARVTSRHIAAGYTVVRLITDCP